jgi:hypothetical protein
LRDGQPPFGSLHSASLGLSGRLNARGRGNDPQPCRP